MYISLLASFLKEIVAENCDHKVWRNETAVLIHKHHAVSISVIDDTDVRLGFSNQLLKIYDVLRIERIRLVVRETAIHLLIYICRLVAEDITYKE